MPLNQFCQLHKRDITKSSLSGWNKDYDEGRLKEDEPGASEKKRNVKGMYTEVEKKLDIKTATISDRLLWHIVAISARKG